MKIFAGSSGKNLAEKVAKALKLKVSPLEIHVFPDGEKRVRVLEKVIEETCVIIEPTCPPAEENYFELFFIADALKRGGARSVVGVVPYLGYQRQDHIFREGEAVSLAVAVKTLEAVGINKIITFDLHSIRIQDIFKIQIAHLSALPLFAKTIRENNWDDGNTVLVSPDRGGIRRVKLISESLRYMPYAVIEKERDLATGKVTAGKIEGKTRPRAIVIDDMISSGETIKAASSLLKKNGAEEIYVFATHAVFSSAAKLTLQKSLAKKVFVTDTINIPKEKRFPKLEILSVSSLIANALSD